MLVQNVEISNTSWI